MEAYQDFIASKALRHVPTGLENIPELNPMLFGFQRDIVKWALLRGRSAIFADCGMGKSFMPLEWAKHIPGKVLILAPLAVSAQTVREGIKFGIDVAYSREPIDAHVYHAQGKTALCEWAKKEAMRSKKQRVSFCERGI